MKYTERCQCCGHVKTAYTLPMNEGMVRAFVLFMREFARKKTKTHAGAGVKKGDIGLSNSQYGNFQNLRHFGLIFQVHKGGPWTPTQLGWNFYLGTATILNPAGHMAGETLAADHAAWNTHPQERRRITIHEVLPEEWKQREEFQQEKSPQGQLAL